MSLRSRFILTLLLTFGLGVTGAKADTFSFSGALAGGGSVSGTFSLDEPTSTLTAFDLVAPGFEFIKTDPTSSTTNSTGTVNFCNCYVTGTQTTPVTGLFFQGNDGSTLLLQFNTTVSGFDASTFFTGGATTLIGASGAESRLETSLGDFFFASGTGSPVSTSPAPEPSSLLLLGIGLVGLAGASFRSLWSSPPSPTGPHNFR